MEITISTSTSVHPTKYNWHPSTGWLYATTMLFDDFPLSQVTIDSPTDMLDACQNSRYLCALLLESTSSIPSDTLHAEDNLPIMFHQSVKHPSIPPLGDHPSICHNCHIDLSMDLIGGNTAHLVTSDFVVHTHPPVSGNNHPWQEIIHDHLPSHHSLVPLLRFFSYLVPLVVFSGILHCHYLIGTSIHMVTCGFSDQHQFATQSAPTPPDGLPFADNPYTFLPTGVNEMFLSKPAISDANTSTIDWDIGRALPHELATADPIPLCVFHSRNHHTHFPSLHRIPTHHPTLSTRRA